MYGQIVSAPKQLSASGPPPVAAKPRHDNISNNSIKQASEAPAAPMRKKTSKSSRDSHHYDVPKTAGIVWYNATECLCRTSIFD